LDGCPLLRQGYGGQASHRSLLVASNAFGVKADGAK
jgi:hypothetical protein